MDKVLKLKGEGLMLKDPESFYEKKRSKKLLKVKKFDDAEAIVIGH
jgi:DNA ligase-1